MLNSVHILMFDEYMKKYKNQTNYFFINEFKR